MLTCGQGIKLSIEPLLSKKGVVFISYESNESVGGSIPSIVVTIKTQEDPCNITDVMDCKVISESGWSIKFKAYVIKMDYVNTNCKILMYGCDPEFSRNNVTSNYSSIDKAIKSTFKQSINSNVDLRTVFPDVKLYQKNESNESFLRKLMNSLKYGTIYAFGLGELIVRDTSNWKEEYAFTRALDASPITSQGLMNPKVHEQSIEVLEEFTNHIKIKFDDNIVDVDKSYKDLVMNRLNNLKNNSPKSDFTFNLRYLPPITLCSNITIYSKETRIFDNYVTSRQLKFNYTDFNAVYTVKSLNP